MSQGSTSRPAGQTRQLRKGRSLEVSHLRDLEGAQGCHRWCRGSPADGYLGVWARNAPVANSGDTEGAQGECLWRVRRGITGCLPC